tara:strand:+ start:17293 stop:18552 length:1260 start_codon:yes stop_codon:yes gene_type:complete
MKTKSFFLPGGGIDVAAMQAHRDSMPTGAIGMPRPGAQHPSEILNELVEDFSEFGDSVKATAKETREAIAETRARLQAIEQHVVGLETTGQRGGHMSDGIAAQVLQAAREDSSFLHIQQWNHGSARISLSAGIRAALTNQGLGSSSDTAFPGNPDRRGMVGEVFRRLRLMDILPSRPVSTGQTEFVQMGSSGDAAEQEIEGDEKQQIDMEGTLVTANVVTIAAWTTASRQVLSDETALQREIDRVLRFKCLARLEHQLINGIGGSGKINGLVNQATVYTNHGFSVTATNYADQLGGCVSAMETEGYLPSAIILNPIDALEHSLTKDAEHRYLFGNPAAPAPLSLWNLPVVTTPSMPLGSAMVLDASTVSVTDREAPSVVVSNSHADYFTRNLVAVLGELRAGLEVLDTRGVRFLDLNPS